MSSLVSSANILTIVPDSIPPEISPNNFNVQQKRNNTHPMNSSLQPIQRHIMNHESKHADVAHIVDKDSVRMENHNQNKNETKATNARNERYADQHLSQNKTVLHPTIDDIINHAIFTDSDSLMYDSTHNHGNRKSRERRKSTLNSKNSSSKNEIEKIKNFRGFVIMNAGGSKVYAHSQILDMDESKIMPLSMESSIIVSQPSTATLLPLLENAEENTVKDEKTDLINKLIFSSMKINGVAISQNIPPQISDNEPMIVFNAEMDPIIILSSDDEIAERDYSRILAVKDGQGYKLISGQLVRNSKVQTLVKQLANAANVDGNGVKEESMESRSAWVNACPKKHSYSTYYERKKSIAGVLMNSQQVFKQYCTKMRLLNRRQKNQSRNENDWNLTFFDKGCMVDDLFENMLKLKPKNRTRSRIEQTNLKKARKYELPNDNLSRMEIRDDIRRMKEPKLHDLLSIINDLGYESFAPVYEQLIKEQSISSWDVHLPMFDDMQMKWNITEYQSEHEIQYEFQPPTTHKKHKKDKERDRDRDKKRKRRKKEKKRRKRERSRTHHKHSSKHHSHHNIQIQEQTEKELSVSVVNNKSLKRRFNRNLLPIIVQEPWYKKKKLSLTFHATNRTNSKQTLPLPNFSNMGLQNTIPMSFTAADAQRHKISRNCPVSVPGPVPLPVSYAPLSVITIEDDDEDIGRNINMNRNMNANPPKKCCICAQMFTLEVDLMLHTMIEHKKIKQQQS